MEKDEIKHHRYHDTKLLCKACRKTSLTNHDTTLYRCDACSTQLGRDSYDARKLSNKRHKTKVGQTYTLVCNACAAREETILATLETKLLRLCTCRHRTPSAHDINARSTLSCRSFLLSKCKLPLEFSAFGAPMPCKTGFSII